MVDVNTETSPAPSKLTSKPDSPSASHRTFKRVLRRLALLPLLAVGGLYLLSMTSKPPGNLGETNGQLAKCPDSQNCVSSQSTDSRHQMVPISFVGTKQEMIEKIKALVATEFPRASLIREKDNYLHFEFTSAIFRFVDDVEFLVDDKADVVHFRSASRVGHSDLGANRKRMEKISESLTL